MKSFEGKTLFCSCPVLVVSLGGISTTFLKRVKNSFIRESNYLEL